MDNPTTTPTTETPAGGTQPQPQAAPATPAPATPAAPSMLSDTGGQQQPSQPAGSQAPADGLSAGEQRQAGESDMDWRHRLAQGVPDADREAFLNEAGRSESEGAFAKRFLDMRRQASKMIPVPDPSDENARREIYTKLGAPETADAYQISEQVVPAANLSDTDKAVFDEAKPVFHRHGLTQAAVDDMLQMQAKHARIEAEAKAARAQDLESERMTELKSQWGRDFDDNVAVYRNAVTYTMGDKAAEFAELRLEDGTLVSNHPLIARAFTKFGRERAADDTDFTVLNASRKQGAQDRLTALTKELASKGIGPGHPDYPQSELDNLYKQVGSTRGRSPNGLPTTGRV